MDVFVYGTLTDPDRTASVLDAFEFGPDATLVGCHRVEGAYPTLAPGGETEGRILRTANLGALDAYEGVDRGLYVRETLAGPAGPCAVYVGDPERLDADTDATWPGSGAFPERVRRWFAAHDARVRPDGG
ncbi:gamma-glutamylcyclotransferase family protein [Halomarina rubra]|uniref:Gamma-glutamylcyclotransferase family protein n=1 Tax=Halomarina rubra TaxID=2071873 RepID=A0ABD6AU70_9EURY|nr:gamma-glutamylcyclotransferase family protein [Halomarina rubra]